MWRRSVRHHSSNSFQLPFSIPFLLVGFSLDKFSGCIFCARIFLLCIRALYGHSSASYSGFFTEHLIKCPKTNLPTHKSLHLCKLVERSKINWQFLPSTCCQSVRILEIVLLKGWILRGGRQLGGWGLKYVIQINLQGFLKVPSCCETDVTLITKLELPLSLTLQFFSIHQPSSAFHSRHSAHN